MCVRLCDGMYAFMCALVCVCERARVRARACVLALCILTMSGGGGTYNKQGVLVPYLSRTIIGLAGIA